MKLADGDLIQTNGACYRVLYSVKRDNSAYMCRRLDGKGGVHKVETKRVVKHVPGGAKCDTHTRSVL